MKNVLLTGQLIWDALQAESGDFDVLWEVLQSQKVQGYITQNDLDTLYRQIAQEQDVSVAFSLVSQLRRVLLIRSSNCPQPIDIEVNNSVYPHSVAIELAEAPVLSLHGFLERYALQMLYTNDTLTDGSDPETVLGMQQWYRKWRQSGFDMLWLIPVFLTLALQSMPYFQKLVADLFEQLEGGQTPQSPEIAQKNRRSEPSPIESPGARSPFIPFPRLPNRNSSPAEPSPSNSNNEALNLPDLPGDSLRYPSRISVPSATDKTATPQNFAPLPTLINPIDRVIEVQPAPSLPSITLPNPPSSAPADNEQYYTKPDNEVFVPTPVFGPPLTPIELDPGTPIETPLEPAPDPLPIIDLLPSPPAPPSTPSSEDIWLDIAVDEEGVMIIPDPLIDPSTLTDPSLPNQPPLPNQSQNQIQPNLPDMPDDWIDPELGYDPSKYGKDYDSILAPVVGIPQSGGIGVIFLDNSLIEMPPSGLGVGSSPELNFKF
jgi:hypothetical protein